MPHPRARAAITSRASCMVFTGKWILPVTTSILFSEARMNGWSNRRGLWSPLRVLSGALAREHRCSRLASSLPCHFSLGMWTLRLNTWPCCEGRTVLYENRRRKRQETRTKGTSLGTVTSPPTRSASTALVVAARSSSSPQAPTWRRLGVAFPEYLVVQDLLNHVFRVAIHQDWVPDRRLSVGKLLGVGHKQLE